MKIIYRKGDLLECEEKIIVHGCNAQGRMGAGVAKAIRAKYPKAYREYIRAHQTNGLELGQVICVDCGDKLIINAITQEHYGRAPIRYVSYTAVRKCMVRVNHFFDAPCYAHYTKQVAMPKIGAGLAGGDWDVIAQIIEEESTNFQPVIYELQGKNGT